MFIFNIFSSVYAKLIPRLDEITNAVMFKLRTIVATLDSFDQHYTN